MMIPSKRPQHKAKKKTYLISSMQQSTSHSMRTSSKCSTLNKPYLCQIFLRWSQQHARDLVTCQHSLQSMDTNPILLKGKHEALEGELETITMKQDTTPSLSTLTLLVILQSDMMRWMLMRQDQQSWVLMNYTHAVFVQRVLVPIIPLVSPTQTNLDVSWSTTRNINFGASCLCIFYCLFVYITSLL